VTFTPLSFNFLAAAKPEIPAPITITVLSVTIKSSLLLQAFNKRDGAKKIAGNPVTFFFKNFLLFINNGK
jgi:hypothetical protein